jgi:cell wall-associated NlpC family hydrolase
VAQSSVGRHRAPGRFNPLSELKLIAKETAQPAAKGAAIVAASGGLVATFASPANAEGVNLAAAGSASSASVAPAVMGPKASGLNSANALTAIGFATTKAAPAKKSAPRVIKDVLLEQKKAEEAERRAEERREAAARASRTTTRAALSTAPQTASGIVGIAQTMIGVPYVYGGSTPSGFDCSGFTSWVYRQAGVSIPRTASQQQAAARRVATPQAGDLVFFGYPAYHVGIYVSPGRMIDAQRPGTTVGYHSIWTTPSGFGRF